MATVTIHETDDPAIAESRPSHRGDPTWEIAGLYPRQGAWTEDEYLALNANQLIEFSDGVLEFLPMPTLAHQNIVVFLFQLLASHVESRNLGKVVFAPLPVKLFKGRYREPDVVFLNHGQVKVAAGKYPQGADLVVEVISEGEEARKRDLEDKPADYAKAGVKEYWIVDPETRTIKVLTLDGKQYKTHGEFTPGHTATSALFDGFSVNVDEVFAAAEETSEPRSTDQPESD